MQDLLGAVKARRCPKFIVLNFILVWESYCASFLKQYAENGKLGNIFCWIYDGADKFSNGSIREGNWITE